MDNLWPHEVSYALKMPSGIPVALLFRKMISFICYPVLIVSRFPIASISNKLVNRNKTEVFLLASFITTNNLQLGREM